MLRYFKEQGLNFGCEPTNIAKIANEKGLIHPIFF